MIKKISVILALLAVASVANAQTPTAPTQVQSDPSITDNGVVAEVKAIDPASQQIIVKTDAGSVVTVRLGAKTIYMRLAPGEKTLTNATKIALTDVSEGDRVWARGKVADDRKSVPAVALIVMTRADITKKQEAERAEWRKRGILGVITALKPEAKELTISSRSAGGIQSVVIPVTEKVELRRYAPDSIKFADAKPSSFAELKVGDQLRALGEKSSEGTQFAAEKIVTGAFRTVAGSVTGVDVATGEIKINDLQSKQPLTIVVKQDAVLRKFPAMEEMGGMMMMRRPADGGGGHGAGAGNPHGPPAQAGPGGGRPGMGGGVNINDMLERLPTVSVADVKVGDTIIVSSTQGADPTRLTAIALVTGADTLLNILAARQQQGGARVLNPEAGLGTGITFGIGLP